MARAPKLRVPREQPGGITPHSHGRRSQVKPISVGEWASSMYGSLRGAQEVMVKITGGGRDVDGVQAHFEYLDRHGKLELEDDRGERHQGDAAGTELIHDWGLGYGALPGSPHSRTKIDPTSGRPRLPARQAFNLILSMPPGTPPQAVLNAARKFARETFAFRHRYVLTLHTNDKTWNAQHNPQYRNPKDHGKHPHVHLVVKAEHEYGEARLNPRRADLRRWRQDFATYLREQGVAATATRREDRGLPKTHKRAAPQRAMQRNQGGTRVPGSGGELYTEAGDSRFMRRKLEAVKRELQAHGKVRDQTAYRALLNVRADVAARWQAGIGFLRAAGREQEARRFEMVLANLPPVQTEQQLIAAALARQRGREPPAPAR